MLGIINAVLFKRKLGREESVQSEQNSRVMCGEEGSWIFFY